MPPLSAPDRFDQNMFLTSDCGELRHVESSGHSCALFPWLTWEGGGVGSFMWFAGENTLTMRGCTFFFGTTEHEMNAIRISTT